MRKVFLAIVGMVVGLALAVPLMNSGNAASHTVIGCFNANHVLESTRVGYTPQTCAHPTDTYESWTVTDFNVPTTTTTTIGGGIPPTTTTTTTPTTIVTTTTLPAPTTTTGGTIGSVKPPTGGYFQLLPPGSAFPSDAACAALVHHSTWEPRPDNTTANHTVPPVGYLTGQNGDWTAAWNANYRTRIDGNFTGTTDEIIQWAACKWGWSDELVRGEAVDETDWHQNGTGDTSSTAANCWPGYSTPCPTSFGFLQIKWYYNPSHTIAGNSMPWARDSTAFNIDYTLAELRGCYDSMSTYLGNTTGNLAGCVGSWFSGSWDPSGGAYWTRVNGFTQSKPWLNSGF